MRHIILSFFFFQWAQFAHRSFSRPLVLSQKWISRLNLYTSVRNQCTPSWDIYSGNKNYEGRKDERKEVKRTVAQSWRETECNVRISRASGQGRYSQFRGSIHKQVGDTNLSARVTFSPSPSLFSLFLPEKARSKANDFVWLSRAKARRHPSFRDSTDCAELSIRDCKYNLIYIKIHQNWHQNSA